MGPIGIFDSGFGGLTVLDAIRKELPEYDYLYLGDNARTPYGTRDFDTVLEFTWQAVEYLFKKDCSLVILACNTASAKALRTIQQTRLRHYPGKNVLGVIRPTTESIQNYTKTNQVGILATQGTVLSETYPVEIQKFAQDIKVFQQACPMWVPLIENNEHDTPGGMFFIEKYIRQLLDQSNQIDCFVLGCTHYPILIPQIRKIIDSNITVINQGNIVAPKLREYLNRHPEYDEKCSKGGQIEFETTDDAQKFEKMGSIFYNQEIKATRVKI